MSTFPRAVGLLAALVALAVGVWSCAQERQNEIRIGVLLPLSGEAATWGASMREGIELAVDVAREDAGAAGKRLAVAYEDDQGTPRLGVSAAQKLLDVDRVRAVVGVANSSVASAIMPIIDQRDVLFVSGGASSPDLSGISPRFFRTWPPDDAEAIELARYVARQGYCRVGVLYINNDYGVGYRGPFTDALRGSGCVASAAEAFSEGAVDFAPQLLRTRDSEPDAIVIIGNPRELARAIRQLRDLGISIPVFSTSAFRDPEVLQIAGPAAEGVHFADASFDIASRAPGTRRFVDAFRSRYGRDPGMLAATGFDAMRAVIDALQATTTTAEAVAFLRSYEISGAAGVFRFDARGNVSRPARISVVKGGTFVDASVQPL